MNAAITSLAIVCCMPWHCRTWVMEPVRGDRCTYCRRDIAVPVRAKARLLACIYCGMDRGLIPISEIEP